MNLAADGDLGIGRMSPIKILLVDMVVVNSKTNSTPFVCALKAAKL